MATLSSALPSSAISFCALFWTCVAGLGCNGSLSRVAYLRYVTLDWYVFPCMGIRGGGHWNQSATSCRGSPRFYDTLRDGSCVLQTVILVVASVFELLCKKDLCTSSAWHLGCMFFVAVHTLSAYFQSNLAVRVSGYKCFSTPSSDDFFVCLLLQD